MAIVGAAGVAGAASPMSGIGASRPGGGGAFADVLKRAARAQGGLDAAITRATGANGLGSGDLLALQAQMYRSSLELDLASKIVEKVSSGIKQTLSTNA